MINKNLKLYLKNLINLIFINYGKLKVKIFKIKNYYLILMR